MPTSTAVMVTEGQGGTTFTRALEELGPFVVVVLNYDSNQLVVSINNGAYEPWYTFQDDLPLLGALAMEGLIMREVAHLLRPVLWPVSGQNAFLESWTLATHLIGRVRRRASSM